MATPNLVPIEDILVNLPDSIKGFNILVAASVALTISTGVCRDSTNTFDMFLNTPIDILNTGTGVNGLDTGTVAPDTCYYVYVIGSQMNALPTAGLISTSATPIMPKGYDIYRRIGWAFTDGSAGFILMFQDGFRGDVTCYFDVQMPVLAGGTSTTYADVDLSTAVPPINTSVTFETVYTPAVAGNGANLRPAGSSSTGFIGIIGNVTGAAQSEIITCLEFLVSGDEPAVEYQVTTGDTLLLNVISFVDHR